MTGPELIGVLIGLVALALIVASQAGYGRTNKEKE